MVLLLVVLPQHLSTVGVAVDVDGVVVALVVDYGNVAVVVVAAVVVYLSGFILD
jgi:hypothetical protein